MISRSIISILALAVLSFSSAKSGGDAVQVVLYQGDARAGALNIKEMLKNANLDSKGYSKNAPSKDSISYYKTVDCARTLDIQRELDHLLPGLFGEKETRRLYDQIQRKQLERKGQCKVEMVIANQVDQKDAVQAIFKVTVSGSQDRARRSSSPSWPSRRRITWPSRRRITWPSRRRITWPSRRRITWPSRRRITWPSRRRITWPSRRRITWPSRRRSTWPSRRRSHLA
ncbi:PREDICTED: uncharacterized protein LOC107329521 isoform X2 [Acropora digitifera]|uniref:uncharacterized protein LOC107329521 isoform X2 n=1 Tax=Acropora digitifera TaxID=70779 RepID=UPI00077B0262|nr:PREDICTED: uncharacterized protein LOC107329521 isoform X2 [Acropora digitifera]